MEKLTTPQAAARLGVSEGHIRKLVQVGKLTPTERYPRLLLFALTDIDRYAMVRRPAGNPNWRKVEDEAVS